MSGKWKRLSLAPGLIPALVWAVTPSCPKHYNELSSAQKNTLSRAYHLGAPQGMGLTLAALAWHESCAGEIPVNFSDPAAGVFHTYIPGVFDRNPTLKRTPFMSNAIGARLIADLGYAAKETLSELAYWKSLHPDWEGMMRSYNTGNQWTKDASTRKRADSYVRTILALKKQLAPHYTPRTVTNHPPLRTPHGFTLLCE